MTPNTVTMTQNDVTRRPCRLCHERLVAPSRMAVRDYRCSRCVHRSVSGQARQHRYVRGASRKAITARSNRQRVFIGCVYHSWVPTADEAERINAHIKERTREFVERQPNREEAESDPARGVPAQAAV